jgi:hypothetical protein
VAILVGAVRVVIGFQMINVSLLVRENCPGILEGYLVFP